MNLKKSSRGTHLKGGLYNMKKISVIGKSGKGNAMLTVGGISLILILGFLVWNTFGGTQGTGIGGGTGGISGSAGVCKMACPDSLTWSGVVDLQNRQNASTETFDSTMYFYNTADNSLKSKITDTTAGAVTLTCGQQYRVEVISTSGASGDGSTLFSSDLGEVNSDGNLIINACGSGSTFTIQGEQHGLLKIRSYDLKENANAFNNASSTAGTYVTVSPANFTSTTNNATATAVGVSGDLDFRHEIRAQIEDENVNDRGVYVLVDLDPTIWQEPTVQIDGSTVSNYKGSLNADEKSAYSNYEFVYLIPASKKITLNADVKVRFNILAVSGVNPTATANPLIDYAPVGKYASNVQNNVLKIGSVQDDSSKTVVHTKFQTIQAIS